jgi:hypothetical protein
MKYTIYVKKEIKSEADLPKEDGQYFTHQMKTNYLDCMFWYEDDRAWHVKSWLYHVDWYLQPIELDLPDDEEIVKQFPYAYDDLDIQNSIQWLRDKIKDQLK